MNTSRFARAAAAACALFALTASAVRAASTCTDFGTIFVSKYFLNNNVWGQDSSPSGWNCIWNSNSTSPLNWGTSYNWPVNGNPYSVKAYPAVISGWHWGTWSNGSGLPTRIWDNKAVNTGASFSISNPGVQNVAYDCWFHTISNPTWQNNPTDELMIWTARYGGAGPLGTFQGNATIAGATWAVYRGNIGWNVFSFVRTSNTTSWSFNIRDFIHYVVYTKGWMANSKYLTSVQFGTEVFSTNGQGQLNVTNYRVNVQ
jgi:xyloglucan-specific endo-beta-1,4-glucanase